MLFLFFCNDRLKSIYRCLSSALYNVLFCETSFTVRLGLVCLCLGFSDLSTTTVWFESCCVSGDSTLLKNTEEKHFSIQTEQSCFSQIKRVNYYYYYYDFDELCDSHPLGPSIPVSSCCRLILVYFPLCVMHDTFMDLNHSWLCPALLWFPVSVSANPVSEKLT